MSAPPPRRRRPKADKDIIFHKAKKSKAAPKPAARPVAAQTPVTHPDGPATFAVRPRSASPTQEASVIPIYTTKRALLEGLRYHVARLQSKELADITEESQFIRPIRLHRRDPRIQPGGDGMELDSKDDVLDEKERERVELAKLERQRIREENAKQIAPTTGSKKKPQAFKKKVEQVYRTDDNPEDRKRSQLRYEEALPWHLEDFDDKHIWQGYYEAALSECHVVLMQQPQDSYRDSHLKLVPMEKWYRFREKNKVKTTTLDDIDALMNKKTKDPAFLVKHEQQEKIKKLYALDANKTRGLFQRAGGRDEDEAKDAGGDGLGGEIDATADADDIDFDLNEEFADDDENPIFEGDEHTREQAEERVKRDRLAANIFGLTDEQQVEEEAEREKKMTEVRKQLEKVTRKQIIRREKLYEYATDSDGNPYTSSSEDEDSDAERAREAEEAKQADEEKEEKQKQKGAKGKGTEKPSSGASGANTPSGRTEKHGDTSRKSQSSSLKRPGSPNLSEASGNESSRKKMKKQHGIRLAMSPKATPSGSRAGSPAANTATPPFPTKEDVLAKIPDGGISVKGLIALFKSGTFNKEKQTEFIKLVKEVAIPNKETGLLVKRKQG